MKLSASVTKPDCAPLSNGTLLVFCRCYKTSDQDGSRYRTGPGEILVTSRSGHEHDVLGYYQAVERFGCGSTKFEAVCGEV